VTILGTGPHASTVVPLLLDAVQAALIPTLDNLARSQAAAKYAGKYETEGSANQSAAITLTADGPGLRVSKWINRGIDMLKSFDVLMFDSDPADAVAAEVRLYPIGIGNRWSVGFSNGRQQNAKRTPDILRGSACLSWMTLDAFHYGKVPLDEIVFDVNEEGRVEGLDIPVLRVKLARA
jgi:hypothetical protein